MISDGSPVSEIIADVCLDDALAQELVATWAFEIGAPKAGVSLEAIEFQGSAFADFYDPTSSEFTR